MGKSSRGVIAVGRLLIDRDPAVGAVSPASTDGPALAAAVGAWLVGVDAAVCAVIGPDFPTRLILEFTRAGIDTSRIQPANRSGSPARADLEPLPEQLASLSPRWSVHVCGLSLDRQRDIVRTVRPRAACVTLDVDAAEVAEAGVPDVLTLAAQCDAFLPGQAAVAQLWPGEAPRSVLRLMARAGIKAAVIKLGVGGSLGIREGDVISMPAFPVTASGRIPAGEVYSGAFAAIYATEQDLHRAMAWATAAASVAVESNLLLGHVSEFARNRVEARARILEGAMRAAAE
jgi:sugar/nucleoside kinase (ribokinase family)